MLPFRSKKKVGPAASLHGAEHCQATGDADFNGPVRRGLARPGVESLRPAA